MTIVFNIDFTTESVTVETVNALTFGQNTAGGAVDSVNGETGDVVLTTSNIAEGNNLYFTAARVRATVLTGLSLATNAAITAADTALSAFGKLQAQITHILTGDLTFTGLKAFAREIILSPIATPIHQRGKLYFDDANDCLSYMDSVSGRSTQIGYEVLMLARNNTGATILNGKVVYVSGAIGTNSTIALANASSESTSKIIGVATHDIANNTVGRVVVFGLANDLNTSAFADGDELFLSAITAGELTSTPPASPNFVVSVGIVERSHVTQGKIMIRPSAVLANNNALGTSQKVAVTQNAVKNYVDLARGQIAHITTGDVITTSSVASNVTGLAVALEANSSYSIEGYLGIGCSGVGGVFFGANAPIGNNIELKFFGSTSATAFNRVPVQTSNMLSILAVGTQVSAANFVMIDGFVETTNAGTFQIIFASAVNLQTSTVFANTSWIKLTKK